MHGLLSLDRAFIGTQKELVFEHRREPLLPRSVFYARLARSAALGSAIILASLGVGVTGYHFLEGMSWLDSFLNGAMILSGMGPADSIKSVPGKVFAGCYALFSGLAFLGAVGVVFAPIFHRFIHRFHLETEAKAERHKPNRPSREESAPDESLIPFRSSPHGPERTTPAIVQLHFCFSTPTFSERKLGHTTH